MSRCTVCDWSPTQDSLSFISPKKPQVISAKGGVIICNVCEDEIENNLMQITPSEEKDDTESA